MPLPVDDRLRHAQYGIEPLLHVLDQPARLLQLGGERLAAAAAAGELGVQAVDASLGIASAFRLTRQTFLTLRTFTSGTT